MFRSMPKSSKSLLGVLLFGFQVAEAEMVKSDKFPIVVSTWPFLEAVRAAWRSVDNGSSAVEAVVEGCSACEELRCDGTGVSVTIVFSSCPSYPLYFSNVYFLKVTMLLCWC